jgi:predicted HAD superfamily Cof-like phosphohydrolase
MAARAAGGTARIETAAMSKISRNPTPVTSVDTGMSIRIEGMVEFIRSGAKYQTNFEDVAERVCERVNDAQCKISKEGRKKGVLVWWWWWWWWW